MEHQSFLSRINWRQLLIHFIAGVFFIQAFVAFAYLTDPRFIIAYKTSYGTALNALIANGVKIAELTNFLSWLAVVGVIASLATFIVSLLISIKRGWFWLNPIIVLIAIYTLDKLTPLGKQFLKPVHQLISLTTGNPVLEFAIKGIPFLAIGIFLFFYPRLIRFVEKGLPQPVPERTA